MKEEIVKKYLSSGKLLTPQALEMLLAHGSAVTDEPGFIINEQSIRQKPEEKKETGSRVIKNLAVKKTELTKEDFLKFYQSKYEKLRNILVDKLQKPFVSINKLSSYRDEVYIIGIVMDKREKEGKKIIDIEDTTGSATVIFDQDTGDIELDDVIAVRAISSKDVLFGKQVIFPDVPLRKPATGLGKICVAGGLNINEAPKSDIERFFFWFEKQPIQYLLFAGDAGDLFEFERMADKYCYQKTVFFIPGDKDTGEEYPQLPVKFDTNKIISLSNPSMVEINGVKILLVHKFDISMLKKRYLGKSRAIMSDDYLVLEDVPDIVCFGQSKSSQVSNYKSVTIVSAGHMLADFRPIIIDLETRDVQQISIG